MIIAGWFTKVFTRQWKHVQRMRIVEVLLTNVATARVLQYAEDLQPRGSPIMGKRFTVKMVIDNRFDY